MQRDDVNYGCIAVRFGTVGIVCVTDGAVQVQLAQEVFSKLFEHKLHPLQFAEMTAKGWRTSYFIQSS